MFGVFIYEESVLVLLLFFFWLCDYLIDESVFVFMNCDSVQLCNYIIKIRERVESLDIRENISV